MRTEMKYICAYCGVSDRGDPIYKQAAADLGAALAKQNATLIYGGARFGLMGVLADAMVASKAHVVGFTTEHIHTYEGSHEDISELYVLENMHARKHAMFDKADAFIILPGGFGTLDEFFEVLTWRQIRLHDKPIIVLNINGYWNPLKALLQHIRDQNFAQPETARLCTFVDSVAEAIHALYPADAV